MRVVFTGRIGAASPWAAVMWGFVPGSTEVTTSALNTLAAFLGNAYGTNVINKMADAVHLDHCHISFYGADLDLIEGDATLALSGSVAPPSNSAQVALGITWRIAIGYRGGHPRTYVPGVPISAQLNERSVTSIFASSLAAGANTFHTNWEGYTADEIPSLQHGAMSFIRAKEWRTPPVFVRINGATVDTRLDTQRRRVGADVA